LSDAAFRIGNTVRILGCKALIVVRVTVQDYVGIGLVQIAPERSYLGRISMMSRCDQGAVPECEDAGRGALSQIFPQPFFLLGSLLARNRFAFVVAARVQRHDVPRAQIEAVVSLAAFPGLCTEKVEVSARVFGVVFVVAGRRMSDVLQLLASPVERPGLLVCVSSAPLVLAVPENKNRCRLQRNCKIRGRQHVAFLRRTAALVEVRAFRVAGDVAHCNYDDAVLAARYRRR
jgi:hypothetical protein